MSARQMGERLGITHQSVLKLEQAEIKGAITLESLGRYAKAMDCILVYAVIPKEPFQSLDELLDEKALNLAKKILQQVGHSMRLEDQSVNANDSAHQLDQLKRELKESLDPRLWKNGGHGE